MINNQSVAELAEKSLLHTYNRFPVAFDHGKGVYLYDTEGKEYLDFADGIAVCSLGYGYKEYTDALCSLNASNPLELLIATRLSAQCTDARVNIITPALFKELADPQSFKDAPVEQIEELIKSCGLYKTKAKDLKEMATMLVDKYDSQIPDSVEELTKLPGIGRKTANLIVGDVYKKPAVVADTHVIRITNLLGLTTSKDPQKVEMQLKKILPPEESNDFCHRIVLHGRQTCIARRPKCQECALNEICKYANK